MGIHHYTSQTEEQLTDILIEKLNDHKSVFTPQWIITGHNATNNYLKEQIAENNGIAANIMFKQVIPMIEMMHESLGLASAQKKLIYNDQLVWFVDDILGSDDFQSLSEAKKVKDYIDDDSQKRFALAEKISSLFSSYQEEKPALIEAWNNNSSLTDNDDEVWQSHIWRVLKSRFGQDLRDLTVLFSEITATLKSEAQKKALKKQFPALYFYGNLPYSEQLINFLQQLSKVIDIYVIRRTVRVEEENPIIKNLGKVLGRDEDLWKGIPAESFEVENKYSNDLLGLLKENLIENNYPEIEYSKSDDSLVISSSYSVAREVEALYHHLLNVFKKNSGINAKDVTVIVPDLETYAPVIKTYFDYTLQKHDIENPLIPYTIYDTSHRVYASPYLAIEALLSIETDGFTSKNVMKLLDFDYIRERFGFTDKEVLIRALDKANIRHGFTGDEELETNLVSWQYGLKRLIYGFCLPPETGKVTFDGVTFYPVDDFEESDRIELVKLHHFIETLHIWLDNRSDSRSLGEWISFLEKETLDTFIGEQTHDTSKFRRLLGKLNRVFERDVNGSYTFDTIRYYLKGALSNMESGERMGYGGVRFVSPNVFLSVPSKFYAFLGLNSADFPRRVTEVSFDLSDENRLTKTDYDKNLFLSILLAAQDKLYLSYIGSNTKDNSEIPPSSLISELDSHMVGLLNQDLETLTISHPLHNFNSRYNQEEEPLLVNYKLSKALEKDFYTSSDEIGSEGDKNDDEQHKKVIQLKDLTNFIEDPVKHYFTKTLGVYMSDRDIELAENELFSLDELEKWKVKDKITDAKLKDKKLDVVDLKMKGWLPLSELGTESFDQLMEEVLPIVEDEELSNLLLSTPDPHPIQVQIELDDYIVTGRLDTIYDDTLLYLTPSSDKAKYQIRALLNFYVALSEGEVNNLYYLFKNGESKRLNKTHIDISSINQVLEKWCQLYTKGLEELIYFNCAFMNKNENIDKIRSFKESERSRKLNKLILYDTIENVYEKSVFPSDYFIYIARNDAFIDKKKASSFLKMFSAVNELITPLK